MKTLTHALALTALLVASTAGEHVELPESEARHGKTVASRVM